MSAQTQCTYKVKDLAILPSDFSINQTEGTLPFILQGKQSDDLT